MQIETQPSSGHVELTFSRSDARQDRSPTRTVFQSLSLSAQLGRLLLQTCGLRGSEPRGTRPMRRPSLCPHSKRAAGRPWPCYAGKPARKSGRRPGYVQKVLQFQIRQRLTRNAKPISPEPMSLPGRACHAKRVVGPRPGGSRRLHFCTGSANGRAGREFGSPVCVTGCAGQVGA